MEGAAEESSACDVIGDSTYYPQANAEADPRAREVSGARVSCFMLVGLFALYVLLYVSWIICSLCHEDTGKCKF